jgi:dTMP kinase
MSLEVNAISRGRFITLEGAEGVGKSTQARLLSDTLCRRGHAVLQTREPGGAPGAELLRELLLSGRIDWSASAETLLHFAARAEHVEKTVRPALEAGIWVVCDRFFDSTMAYQGHGQGADRSFIATLSGLLGLAPDLTLILDAPPVIAAERLRQRGAGLDRYDRLGLDFHERVRAGFRDIAALNPQRCKIVGAEGAIDVVQARILAAIGA